MARRRAVRRPAPTWCCGAGIRPFSGPRPVLAGGRLPTAGRHLCPTAAWQVRRGCVLRPRRGRRGGKRRPESCAGSSAVRDGTVPGKQAYRQSRARAHYFLELLGRESGEQVGEPIRMFADVVRPDLVDQLEISHVYIAPGRRVFQPGALLNPAEVPAHCRKPPVLHRLRKAAHGTFPVGCRGPFFLRRGADPS
jgi:hypothetical protein